MTKEEISHKVVEILHETFEIPMESIKPESRLFEDLDLDSIDAVDLIVKLQNYTDSKINPEVFKSVRTISDVVDAIHSLALKTGGQEL
ncbi:MAG: acyl carrier protein [Spirochaetaceae bacterium]|nr:MAG: acyl carrier protein [Spirochaetaceae bacterium]